MGIRLAKNQHVKGMFDGCLTIQRTRYHSTLKIKHEKKTFVQCQTLKLKPLSAITYYQTDIKFQRAPVFPNRFKLVFKMIEFPSLQNLGTSVYIYI